MRALWFGSSRDQQMETVLLGLQSRWPDIQMKQTGDLDQALAWISRDVFELAFVSLGSLNGAELNFIQEVRRLSDLPILLVASRDSRELDRAKALYQGADTVLKEPCHPMQVQATVMALLRRYQGNLLSLEQTIQLGDLEICPATCEVFLRGRPIRLTATEFRLLQALAQRKGMVATHDFLTRTLWGEETDTTALRKYVQRLRAKLEDYPENPTWILTVPSVGYRLLVNQGSPLAAQRAS